MATPEKIRESEEATRLFQAALVAFGAKSFADGLTLWADVPPVPADQSGTARARWLQTSARYIGRRRLRSRDMALAYYRYQRALLTGKTIALPGETRRYYSLAELKRLFESYLSDEPQNPRRPESQVDPEPAEDEEQIEAEQIQNLNEALARIEDEAQRQARVVLEALGPNNLDRKLREPVLNPDGTERDLTDKERTQLHRDVGRRQAAAVERISLDGGRGTLFQLAYLDNRVAGWARISTTGTPCGWCAMLISRGAVYKTESSASVAFDDGDLYHDNCKCIAIPVFSKAEFEQLSIFDVNREYLQLWKQHGSSDLTEWRRLFRQRARSRKSQEAAA